MGKCKRAAPVRNEEKGFDAESFPSTLGIMRLEVINTGTELLLGNTLNTHLTYLGEHLLPLGLRIGRQICIPDGDAIREALVEAFPRQDIVIVTGGLGPTSDDITREITAALLGQALAEDAGVLERIRERCADLPRPAVLGQYRRLAGRRSAAARTT